MEDYTYISFQMDNGKSWLFKIPKYVIDLWVKAPDGRELGRIEIKEEYGKVTYTFLVPKDLLNVKEAMDELNIGYRYCIEPMVKEIRHYEEEKPFQSIELNPAKRKRLETRLLRKLQVTINEFLTKMGEQAIVLVITRHASKVLLKVYGSKPLENVIKNIKDIITEDLDIVMASEEPPQLQGDSISCLPSPTIDGIPTPIEYMTQAQLRSFIPLLLRYTIGGRPGWGKVKNKPTWWPEGLPWKNVRMDTRSKEQKKKLSWTEALRQIVINCYKYHKREDLLVQPKIEPDTSRDAS